ncbi:MAG: hypothetical protein ACD_2C00073G0004 [uncultured bacterium (gcode 4)]|uniref:Uncharacterized protein n=1 Tax=uncultured bacterium (gcode 4) TaxID=1234023 RepID=K2FFD6_9BACT|nr:MAG: hypothetical protein ACD_2C00073G0004 [uncultured bacterium (gcode 4)]
MPDIQLNEIDSWPSLSEKLLATQDFIKNNPKAVWSKLNKMEFKQDSASKE